MEGFFLVFVLIVVVVNLAGGYVESLTNNCNNPINLSTEND